MRVVSYAAIAALHVAGCASTWTEPPPAPPPARQPPAPQPAPAEHCPRPTAPSALPSAASSAPAPQREPGSEGGAAGVRPPAPNVAVPIGAEMVPPVLLEGKQPAYTEAARAACVEGKLIARCVITEEGALIDCRIVKSLPFMDQAVLDALATRRYKPVMYKGHPQRVYYTFPFNFRLRPDDPKPGTGN